MPPKRGELTSLTDMISPKPQRAAPAPAAPSPEKAEPVETRRQSVSRIPPGRRGLLCHVSREGWRALKDVAADEETTLQALTVEAINDLLQKRGKPPIA
jgi:hypothetical protein